MISELHFSNSSQSGERFEHQVCAVVKSNPFRFTNFRIQTFETESGTTEIDLLFCMGETIYVIETKNYASIRPCGDPNYWEVKGPSCQDVIGYSQLSAAVQNRLHMKCLATALFLGTGKTYTIKSAVVVPNDCQVSPNLSGNIMTLQEFSNFYSSLACAKHSEAFDAICGLFSSDNIIQYERLELA